MLSEFLETFEQHHNTMNDNAKDYNVTMEEFIEYYTNVSASIDDDMYFSAMMNASWNLQGDAAQYQKQEKGWANEDAPRRNQASCGGYQRVNKESNGQPTQRSGVVSSEFPFG